MIDPSLPHLTLGGTSRKELLDQQLVVMNACRALKNAVALAAPNERDYQLNPVCYLIARDECNADFEHIDAIMDRAKAIADYLVTATGGR
jgi:hypothetical protein